MIFKRLNINLKILFLVLFFSNKESFSQSQSFYFYNSTNANNGFTVSSGGSWSTVSYPSSTDALNSTNAGCVSMSFNASITGGNFLNSSGNNTGNRTPSYQNLGSSNDFWGQRIYVDFTTSNSASSYATIVYSFTSSGSPINIPISFDIFDINSGAYSLNSTSTLNFIDYIQITAKTSAGVNVAPIFSNQCGSPVDEIVTNTIKGNNSCSSSSTKDVTVSFGQNISELTIKYMPGTGEPGNISAATTTGTSFPIASAYDPGKQFIDISALRALDCSTLPVSLLNFNANCINKNVKLNWHTESELNNDYFDVERSNDGNSYASLLRVNGNGTTNEPHQYFAYDEQPLAGTNYYRLKQVDFNGATTYYNPVMVNCADDANISIYPNPNNGSFIVSGISDDDEIQLTDALGRNLFNKKGEINYEVNNLQEGIYFVIIKNKFGVVQTQKIVVQR